MLTRQCTQLLNQLNNLLYTARPELLPYCQTGMPDWMVRLLVQYPGTAKLKKARVKSLAKIPYLSSNRAQQLIHAAKQTVASADDPVTQQLITATARQILHLKKTIENQKKQMVHQCNLPEIELLKSFPGIGTSSAIGLLIEIQTVKRFASAKKLASFFGIHPVYKISGDGVGGVKMSKQGRKAPRQILYMIALSAVQRNPLIRQVYEKHKQQGKHNMAALGICMHKILRILYGMLKHTQPFNPRVDLANRQRNAQATKEKPENRIHCCIQNYDAKAPVSRRQRKKRLEQERSQSVADTQSGITAPVPLDKIITQILPQL